MLSGGVSLWKFCRWRDGQKTPGMQKSQNPRAVPESWHFNISDVNRRILNLPLGLLLSN